MFQVSALTWERQRVSRGGVFSIDIFTARPTTLCKNTRKYCDACTLFQRAQRILGARWKYELNIRWNVKNKFLGAIFFFFFSLLEACCIEGCNKLWEVQMLLSDTENKFFLKSFKCRNKYTRLRQRLQSDFLDASKPLLPAFRRVPDKLGYVETINRGGGVVAPKLVQVQRAWLDDKNKRRKKKSCYENKNERADQTNTHGNRSFCTRNPEINEKEFKKEKWRKLAFSFWKARWEVLRYCALTGADYAARHVVEGRRNPRDRPTSHVNNEPNPAIQKRH